MSEMAKGFHLEWEDNKPRTVDTEVDVSTSRATGVWLVDGDEGEATFRMVVGHRDETDAARAYAAHRKAHGHAAASTYRLFPLLRAEPISEDQLGDAGEETWSAFADAWIEVRL